MNIFPCPFCGPRDETEFHFRGEATTRRPAQMDATPAAWAGYLYLQHNPRGESRELWLHLPCGEVFTVTRDTVTHEVLQTGRLPGAEVGA